MIYGNMHMRIIFCHLPWAILCKAVLERKSAFWDQNRYRIEHSQKRHDINFFSYMRTLLGYYFINRL
jgi:hypothetical protein